MDNKNGEIKAAETKNTTPIRVVAILLFIVVILLIGGYFAMEYFANKKSQAQADSQVAQKSETLTKSSTVDPLAKWPSDLPSEVPKFAYGTTVYASQIGTDENEGWTITIGDVKNTALEKYKKQLEDAGWSAPAKQVNTKLVNVIQYEKSDLEIMVSYDADSSGANITVLKK